MNSNKQKLELTWIGKDKRPRLEPRILLEEPKKSYRARHRATDGDIFDNRLVFGDNLLVLKALEQQLDTLAQRNAVPQRVFISGTLPEAYRLSVRIKMPQVLTSFRCHKTWK